MDDFGDEAIAIQRDRLERIRTDMWALNDDALLAVIQQALSLIGLHRETERRNGLL